MSTSRQFNTPISLSSAALSATHNSNTVANVFTTGGNVGIGTTSPATRFDVIGPNFTYLLSRSSAVSEIRGARTSSTPETILRLGTGHYYGVNWASSAEFQVYNYSSVDQAANSGLNIRLGAGATDNPDTSVMTLLANGRVGIATTAPNYNLDVVGSGDFSTFVTSGALYSTNQTTTNIVATASTITNLSIPGTLTVVNITSTNLVETNITSATILVTGGSFRATHNSNTIGNIFTTGGNIGIDTTSPIYTLDVNGTLEASNSNGLVLFGTSGNVLIGSTTPTPSAFGRGNLMLYGTNATNNGIAIDGLGNTSLQFFNSGTMKGAVTLVATAGNWSTDSRAGDMVIRCASSQSMLFNTNNGSGIATMVISGGNVGIGTTAPESNLTLGAVGCIDQDVNSSYFGANFNTTGGNYRKTGNYANMLMFDTFDGAIKFRNATIGTRGNAITWNERVRINAGGNVGIGTTAPASLLHVHGNSGASDIRLIISDSSIGASITRGLHLIKNASQNCYLYSYEAGFLQLGTNNAGVMTLTSNGNVGIGTGSPSTRLHVNGAITASYSSGGYGSDGGNYNKLTNGAGGAMVELRGNDMYLTSNVGIGTNAPRAALDVNGNIITDWANRFIGTQFTDGAAYNIGMFTNIATRGLDLRSMSADNTGPITFSTGSGPTERMRITSGGIVSIGNNNPNTSTVLFVAAGGSNYSWAAAGYYFNTGTTITSNPAGGWSPSNSILAVGGITSNNGFYATSDIRIKKILKQGIQEINVDDIDKLTISKFEYIDKLVHGNDVKLGFIAQNVYDVVPEAVTIRKEFVPNIFKILNVNGGVIELTNHNLTVGTRVKIMIDEQDRNGHITMVTDIIDENHFCIEYELNDKTQLFVYGTEVDDFKELNYNHIFTLSVGAVQKLRQDYRDLEDKFEKLANFIQAKFPGELTI